MASPSTLLESDTRRPALPGSGAPVADRADAERRGQWRLVLFATLTTTVALLFRYGYSFMLFDQTVYSLRGIALADPSAYRFDWFTRTVPQPHWLFDAITYLGALLTGRWRVASLAALAAGLFHIQHGANLAPILILTAVLPSGTSTRRRL